MGDVDAYFFLEVLYDGSVESHVFCFDVSFDGGFDDCQAEVEWLLDQFGFFDDLFVPVLLLDGFDIDWFLLLVDVDGVGYCATHCLYNKSIDSNKSD